MKVEVVYAASGRQSLVSLDLNEGATIADAIAAAAHAEGMPEVDLETTRFGIFGKLATPATQLAAGDRVEIYRPLLVDPKQARHRRARKKAGQKP